MTDHALMMTPPRSGPYEDTPALREAGFMPVESTRTGGISCWVRHVYALSDVSVRRDAKEIATDFPDLQFLLVWENSTLERL